MVDGNIFLLHLKQSLLSVCALHTTIERLFVLTCTCIDSKQKTTQIRFTCIKPTHTPPLAFTFTIRESYRPTVDNCLIVVHDNENDACTIQSIHRINFQKKTNGKKKLQLKDFLFNCLSSETI